MISHLEKWTSWARTSRKLSFFIGQVSIFLLLRRPVATRGWFHLKDSKGRLLLCIFNHICNTLIILCDTIYTLHFKNFNTRGSRAVTQQGYLTLKHMPRIKRRKEVHISTSQVYDYSKSGMQALIWFHFHKLNMVSEN